MVFMQGEEQPGYSKHAHAYSFIDQKLLATALDNLAMWDKFVHNWFSSI